MKTIVRRRAPASAPAWVSEGLRRLHALGLAESELAALLGGVHPRTAVRWLEGRGLSRFSAAERLRLLTEILDLAREVHGDSYAAWLRTPDPVLGNVLPLTLLKDPADGPRLVREALENSRMGGVA